MMRFALIVAVIALATLPCDVRANAASPNADAPARLVPAPRSDSLAAGVARVSVACTIAVRGVDATDRYALAQLREALAGVPARTRSCVVELRAYRWPAGTSARVQRQGYRLTIRPDRIVIESATAEGRGYGVQTLRQLIAMSPGGTLRCRTILDDPSLEWRGFSDDVSRGQFPTYAEFLRTLDACAALKLNRYFLYIEDTYAFDATPGRRGPALSAVMLRRLTAEARRRHITLVPIVQSLSHQERLLALPDLARYSEHPPLTNAFEPVARATRELLHLPDAGNAATPSGMFSPVAAGSRALVETLLTEVARASGSPYLHLGCDEPGELGAGSSRDAVARVGPGRVYGRYVGALARFVHDRLGAVPLVYGDPLLSHPEAIAYLPAETIVMDWHYLPEDDFSTLRQLRANGAHRVLASAGLWTWFELFPNYVWSFENIRHASDAARREGALGCVASAWGDGGAECLRSTMLPELAYAAAASWESAAPDPATVLDAFAALRYGSPGFARVARLLGSQQFDGVGFSQRAYYRPTDVRVRTPAWRDRMIALRSAMEGARDQLRAEGAARGHADEIAEIRLAVDRYAFLAARELFLDALARNRAKPGGLTERERAAALEDTQALMNESERIITEYESRWLARSEPAGLEVPRVRMRAITAGLQAIADSLAGTVALREPGTPAAGSR